MRAVMVGIVAHVGLAHVGLRQHAADAGIAAGHDRLEAFGLDDARRQRVIGAGHQHELLAGHDGAEFFAGGHVVSIRHGCSACSWRVRPSRCGLIVRLSLAVCSHGCARGHALLPRHDLVGVLERQADVVEAFEQAHAVGGRNVERDVRRRPGPLMRLRLADRP